MFSYRDIPADWREQRSRLPPPRSLPTPSNLAQLWQRLEKEAATARAPMRTVRKSADDASANAVAGAGSPLLPVPTKLVGFTYVSVFLETLSVASTAGMVEPSLTLSVLSAKGQLVEAAQVDSCYFVLSSSLCARFGGLALSPTAASWSTLATA